MRGNPHAAFDAAGAGNVAWSRSCDTRRRKGETTGNTNFDLHRRASPRPYFKSATWTTRLVLARRPRPVAGPAMNGSRFKKSVNMDGAACTAATRKCSPS